MILFIKILIALLIFLLLITVLIIIIPVKYNVNYKLSDKSYGTIKIKLLWGFLSIVYDNKNEHGGLKILIFGFIKMYIKTKAHEENKDKETNSKKNKKFKLKNINTYFLKKLMGYILDMIGILKPRIFKIDGAFGFYDPSNTGIVCACIPLVTSLFPALKINLEPVFHDEILDINIICKGKVNIISAILKTVVFVKEKSIRKVLFG